MGKTLFAKVWESHSVGTLDNGQTQLLIDTHLVHEVTSPQAFGMLRDLGLKVAYPHRTFATVDHIVPTDSQVAPFADPLAEEMIQELNKNAKETGITYFNLASGKQGIVHVVGPEQGITQPGTTIACGDSHTATHGAFGAIAFGIGTTQDDGAQRHESAPHQCGRPAQAGCVFQRRRASHHPPARCRWWQRLRL
jgi:3-isopropylmalate/(R)-2-methylmalate dehydratase large subunit